MTDERCQMTMEEHADAIQDAMAEAGIGGGCEGTYQALLECAEILRLVHGWKAYQPGEYAKRFAAEALALRAQDLARGITHPTRPN